MARVLVDSGAMVGDNSAWAADFIKAKALENPEEASTKGTEMVSLLLKTGVAVPREYQADPTVMAALHGIKEEMKEMRRSMMETTTVLQALPKQLQEGIKMMQEQCTTLSSLIIELDQKTCPSFFVVVPDVTGRFSRGGYYYQGFDRDVLHVCRPPGQHQQAEALCRGLAGTPDWPGEVQIAQAQAQAAV